MAASDELPRGLTLTAVAQSGPSGLTITFPATAGIAWVLTDIYALVWAAVSAQVILTTSLGNPETILNTPASSNNTDEDWTWSGSIAGAVGQAVTITTTNVASVGAVIVARAYPI